jgi:hypothetical protein
VFGKKLRRKAALCYIAEILNQFDLVGLVALRDNLSDLKAILAILGTEWRAIYSDAMLDADGNRERVAYLYDRRAIVFNGLAAEAQPPRQKKGSEYLSEISWWRSPYLASFRAGNFDFMCLTTRVRWGKDEQERLVELQAISDWVYAKANEKTAEDKDILVMGDFNIPSEKSPLYKAVAAKGLKIPDKLLKSTFGSNLEKNKRYDQILHLPLFKESFSTPAACSTSTTATTSRCSRTCPRPSSPTSSRITCRCGCRSTPTPIGRSSSS